MTWLVIIVSAGCGLDVTRCPSLGEILDRRLRAVLLACAKFKIRFGYEPGSIEELVDPSLNPANEILFDEGIKDPWGNNCVVAQSRGSTFAYSLGRGGMPGGEGNDADHVWRLAAEGPVRSDLRALGWTRE